MHPLQFVSNQPVPIGKPWERHREKNGSSYVMVIQFPGKKRNQTHRNEPWASPTQPTHHHRKAEKGKGTQDSEQTHIHISSSYRMMMFASILTCIVLNLHMLCIWIWNHQNHYYVRIKKNPLHLSNWTRSSTQIKYPRKIIAIEGSRR